ncbi:MAG: hypothetical protein R3C10_16515 [Pirellulales bacterium]
MNRSDEAENPFRAPESSFAEVIVPATAVELPAAASRGLYRDRKLLVAAKGAIFPDRCVKCNAPAEGFRLHRALGWHHPAVYLTVLAGVLVYIVLAMVLRKSASVHVGLCPVHHKRRNLTMLAAWLTFLAGMVIMFASIVLESLGLAAFGVVVMLSSVVVGLLKTRVIWPKRIDDNYAWIRGVGEDFLTSIAQETAGG